MTQKLARMVETSSYGAVVSMMFLAVSRMGLPRLRGLAGPAAGNRVIDAEITHDSQERGDIGEPRHIAELQVLLRQKAGDHERQGRILGT
jgi:hypothetical protein